LPEINLGKHLAGKDQCKFTDFYWITHW